jgi:hypothetical protein
MHILQGRLIGGHMPQELPRSIPPCARSTTELTLPSRYASQASLMMKKEHSDRLSGNFLFRFNSDLKAGCAAVRHAAFHLRRTASAIGPKIFQNTRGSQVTNRVGHCATEYIIVQQKFVQEGEFTNFNGRNLSG